MKSCRINAENCKTFSTPSIIIIGVLMIFYIELLLELIKI